MSATETPAARIGRNVKAELVRHNVTHDTAAAEVDLTRQAFGQRAAGKHGGLTGAQLDALALMLGIDVAVFYDGTPSRVRATAVTA